MTDSLKRAISTMLAIATVVLTNGAYGRELRALSTTDGLSDLLVNTIYKDSTGYVWLGTEVGLDRFDGNQIKSYRFPDGVQGPLRVNAITELRRGEMFIGNHQGLFSLAPGSQKLQQVFPEKIYQPVNALADDGISNLYIGTRQGVFLYNLTTNKLRHILLRPDVLSHENEVAGLWVEQERGLWISTRHSLLFLDFKTEQIGEYSIDVPGQVLRLTGRDGMLYLGTHGSGVLPFDMSKRKFLAPIGTGNDIITSLCADADGNLYVATDGEGVYIYSLTRGKVVEHLTSSPTSAMRLRSNSIYSMTVDDRGLLWIGHYQSGVEYTPHYNDTFEIYRWPNAVDTRGKAVRAVALAGKRRIIGTREGLYYVDESTGRHAHFAKPDIKSNIIFCITPYGGRYYVGTYNGGMYVFDPEALTMTPFTREAGALSDGTVFSIEPDSDGDMWIGASDGLHRMRKGKEIELFTSTNSQLPEGNVYEIFFDSAKRGWICTESGMAIWDGATLLADRFPKGFANRLKIRDVYETRDHRLYFAPDRGEMFSSNLELTEFGYIHSDIRDDNRMTTFIVEDPEGWLLLGTGNGLTRYNRRNHFHQFNIADGLPHPVFTLCKPVTDSDGNVWMGNTEGLLRLDFAHFKANSALLHSEIVITDIKSNGHSIMGANAMDSPDFTVSLKGNETDLSVDVANFNYLLPQYSTIEYRLDGHEADWNTTDGTQPIHYYDLPAGDYMLRLRLPGDPSTEAELRVCKSAGLMGYLPAIIIAALVLLGLLMAWIWLRTRHHHAEPTEPAEAEPATAAAEEKVERYRTTRISDEECKRLIKVLDGVMRHDKPYTNPDLKSSDLAAMAGTTSHALSFLFNQYMEKSYYDYVNEYRVAEFKRLVAEGNISKYTLTALSQMCGFSSRASFFRHFKNITGITPAEYMKRQE